MAAKPAILAVDDDVPVLRAVERDLLARYGSDYRILAAGSGSEALELARELTRRGDPIALFVVDQRMPTMTGIELLAEALPLQPDAGPPDSICRHRYRHPRHQRDPPRSVPAQALGSAGGAALSCPRRPPCGLGRQLPSTLRGTAPSGGAMGAARARDPGLSDAQPGPLHLARPGRGRWAPPGRVARRPRRSL